MFDIDVHIIHHKEPKWLLDRCLASLEGQPVNIHLVKGTEERPPSKGRREGFSLGTAKYQSSVDPDDIVKPGAYAKLMEYDGADLIYGKEEVILHTGKVISESYSIHHAYLIKRDALSLDEKKLEGPSIFWAAKKKNLNIQFVDEILYEWHERWSLWT